MIHFNKFFTILLAISALLTSCSDEELLEKKIKVTEGVPVVVSLPFGTHETTKIETRATDIEDKNVNTLAVIVFRKQSDKTIKKEGETLFIENPSGGKITLKTKSGDNYIYAVANYTSSLFDLKEQLEKASTVEDIKNLEIRLPENNISVLDDYFLMSGWFVADDETIQKEEGQCVIDVNGTISSGHIDLKHVMASITFNIQKGDLVESFVADTWQVMSVPESSYLMERENDKEGERNKDYFNSKENSTFKLDMESGIYNFSFLMMENRKETIANTPLTSYDEREEMKNDAGSPKNFVHADPRSTYVVLKGTYKGKTTHEIDKNDTNDEKDVLAYTTYYIHLGDWRNKDYGNFKIFRNNRYIYNVTILGVEELLVEVLTDDQAWGSDGEMYLSSSKAETFDAHYGTTVISFKKDEIKALADQCKSEDEFVNKFVILAATPLNSFVADETDLDWVTYRRNSNDDDRKKYAKYKDSGNSGYDDKLLDAKSFKKDLYRSVTTENELDPDPYDSNGLIYYTCFIDEYFYYRDKEKKEPAEYSMFINQSPRTIQISSNYYKNKDFPSGESSINLATYVFTQKSIWTVYNLENAHEINAWGTESVMEGECVKSTGTGDEGNTDLLQGRENIISFYKGTNFSYDWDRVVDYKTNEMQEEFNTSFYACMNRNRDLNGDGEIDDSEIRWYLPALNQYMGFWMGVDVLPEEVRLYNGNKRLPDDKNKYIYLSSTNRYINKHWSAMLFWASAGSSTSGYRQATEDYSTKVSQELSYRCVRNLKKVTDPVDDYVKAEGSLADSGEENTYRYFTNTYLNPRAMRANVTLPLDPNHIHLGEENRLPMKFQVSVLQSKTNIVWDKDKVKCPPGWRLPNQRELSILAFHRCDNSSEKEKLHSATKSGLYVEDKLEDRRAYYLNVNVLLKPLSDKIAANYRCVKDEIEK